MLKAVALVAAVVAVAGCHPQARSSRSSEHAASDASTHAHPEKVRVTHMKLDLTLEVAGHEVAGVVVLDVERLDPRAPLVLDSQALAITEVRGADGKPRHFGLGPEQPGRGAALTVELAPGDRQVEIHYHSGAGAEALKYLAPGQSGGGKAPPLVTQGQALFTRTWVPMQDTPRVGVSYEATVHAPPGTPVRMSAEPLDQGGDGARRPCVSQATVGDSPTAAPGRAAVTVVCGYYAAPDATGRGTGSITSPFTLTQALTAASVPGHSTICLRGGTYGSGGNVSFQSSVADVVVVSAPGEHAVIDGGLHITGSHFTLRQVEVENSGPGMHPPAIDVEATDVDLVMNLVHDGGDAGVYLRPSSRDVTLEGNLVYANGHGRAGSGVRGQANQLTMRGNSIASNAHEAVDLGSGTDATLQGNAVLGVQACGPALHVVGASNLVGDGTQVGHVTTTSGTLLATSSLLGGDASPYLWVGDPAAPAPTSKRTVDTSVDSLWSRVERIEPGSALVSVAAPHGETEVAIDPTGLGLGSEYEIWNAKNPCGDRPVLGRTPSGEKIHIPLTGWTEATPVAGPASASDRHAFLLTSGHAGDLCGACDHYAGPQVAEGTGTGRLADPWNLQDVLTRSSPAIQPGSTVCLLEGEYVPRGKVPRYDVSLGGTRGSPIHIRPFPGHHVGIDGGFEVHSSHIAFHDLEVYNRGFQRLSAAYKDRAPANSVDGFALMRASGRGPAVTDVKVIDCRVHDAQLGLYTQTSTSDVELYGNVVYNNGWDEPDELVAPHGKGRGHGHGLYLQSNDGLQWATENLIFNNFGAGMELFGNGAMSGYRVLRNSIFEATTAMKLFSHKKGSRHFHVDDVTVQENLGFGGSYAFGGEDGVFGQHDGTDYDTLRLIGNTFVDASYRLQILGWRHPVVRGNVVQVLSTVAAVIGWQWNAPEQTGTFSKVSGTTYDAKAWSHNHWYKPGADPEFVRVNGSASLDWSAWVALGFDAAATPDDPAFTHGALTGQQVFYHPDSYKPLRGSITVFNHDGVSSPSITVDLSAFGFTPGRRYVIRNAFDPCHATGHNIVTGTYSGSKVTLSLDPADYTIAAPLCYDAATGPHAAEIQPLPLPRFGMFLVQPDEPGYCPATEATCTLTR